MKNKKQKRLAILSEISHLLDTECAECENNTNAKKCDEIKCPILDKLNSLGKHSCVDEIESQEVGVVKASRLISLKEYVDLKREGLSDSDVCKKFEMTKNQLAYWKRNNKITESTWNYEGLAEELFQKKFNQYLKLKSQKLYQKEIAAEMGMTEDTIILWLKKNNVKEKVAKLYEYYR